IAGGVVAARRVIAREHLRFGAGRGASIGKKQFDVVVKAETREALEVAAERDADHMGCDLVDLSDLEHAAARFVAHAARCTLGRIPLRRDEGRRYGHTCQLRQGSMLSSTVTPILQAAELLNCWTEPVEAGGTWVHFPRPQTAPSMHSQEARHAILDVASVPARL